MCVLISVLTCVLIRVHIPQLSSAIRFVHSRNKAFRCVNAAKVLVTAQHRLYINGSGILDLVGDRKPPLSELMAEDVRNFGIVLLQTICRYVHTHTHTHARARTHTHTHG